jgi:hypothetical protein
MMLWLRICMLLVLIGTEAAAEVHRIAILAANDEGGAAYQPLYFSEDDAAKLRSVLVNLGDVEDRHIYEAVPATRGRIFAAFVLAGEDIKRAQARGDEVVLLFYYSGHADETNLQLGGTQLSYSMLETMLDNSGAEVRLAFLDACNSGAATRTKGTVRPSVEDFEISERLGTSGSVIVTSSTGDESSQESDEIGGSYFTHYLVSGLAGAADRDSDSLVTLSEAYDYVYHQTVMRTAATRTGTQHPSFEWELSGQGNLVLTQLQPDQAGLVFPDHMRGRYTIFDVRNQSYIAEVDSGGRDQAIRLQPGRYLVQLRQPTFLLTAQLDLREGQQVDLSTVDFRPVEYENDQAKGVMARRLKKAKMPDSSIRILAGGLAPSEWGIRSSYIPLIPMGGAGYRVAWRDGRWVGVDILGGAASTDLNITDIAPVPAFVSSTLVGLEAGYSTRPRLIQGGIGLRIEGLLLDRKFEDEQEVPQQSLLTMTAGPSIWVGVHPRRFEAELAMRSQRVPFQLDGVGSGFTLNQVHLIMGYRF